MQYPNRLATTLCTVMLVAVSQVVIAQSEVVFSTNYDLQLTIDGENRQATSRARVRDGSTIPVPFQNYRVDLQATGVTEDQFRIDLVLFERTDDSYHPTANSTYSQINPSAIPIDGTFGIPVEFKSTLAEIGVNLAIVVSK